MNPPIGGSWRDWLAYAMVAVLIPFLVQYLRSHALAAKADADNKKLDKQAAILNRLREFIFTAAADIAEKQFPILAGDIKSGKLQNKQAVHDTLISWGTALKEEAITHFTQQDIDLVKEVGDQAIVRLIESAANAASPFPGMKTTDAVLQPGVPDMLIRSGVQYVKNVSPQLQCQACIPPCDTCPLNLKETLS